MRRLLLVHSGGDLERVLGLSREPQSSSRACMSPECCSLCLCNKMFVPANTVHTKAWPLLPNEIFTVNHFVTFERFSINEATFWEILCVYLLYRWDFDLEDWYRTHVCLLNMQIQPADNKLSTTKRLEAMGRASLAPGQLSCVVGSFLKFISMHKCFELIMSEILLTVGKWTMCSLVYMEYLFLYLCSISVF